MSYKCNNPTLHQYLGLKCPCYNPKYKHSFRTGELNPVNAQTTTGFPPNIDIFTKATLQNKTNIVEFPEFVPDWEDWSRLIWAPKRFYGDQVGAFKIDIKYGENISGISIGEGFKKRNQHIVTKTCGLVLGLVGKTAANEISMPNGSFLEMQITPPCNQIQFAILSLSFMAGRTDAFRIFVNEQMLQIGDFYCGAATRFTGNTFVGTKYCSDENGEADTIIKVKRDEISKLKIEFANLARNAMGGRLALTDILVK